MNLCERCDLLTEHGLFDYCPACDASLCPTCHAAGCCGRVPARSGLAEEYGLVQLVDVDGRLV